MAMVPHMGEMRGLVRAFLFDKCSAYILLRKSLTLTSNSLYNQV